MRDPGGPRRHQKKHRGEPSPTEVEPLVGTRPCLGILSTREEAKKKGKGKGKGKQISLTPSHVATGHSSGPGGHRSRPRSTSTHRAVRKPTRSAIDTHRRTSPRPYASIEKAATSGGPCARLRSGSGRPPRPPLGTARPIIRRGCGGNHVVGQPVFDLSLPRRRPCMGCCGIGRVGPGLVVFRLRPNAPLLNPRRLPGVVSNNGGAFGDKCAVIKSLSLCSLMRSTSVKRV
ncbi:hypothetical protein BHE74_00010760 [Ensete ventricosum]|nr:hypothetical protein BHE74_00010760 [Ensete ventricosum]